MNILQIYFFKSTYPLDSSKFEGAIDIKSRIYSALKKDFQHLLSLLDSGKLQKTQCQPYRTLMPLCLPKNFVEMIITTAGYCRHTPAPCFMTGKLGHGEMDWFHQKSLRETVWEQSINLMIPTVSHESIMFSLYLLLYKDALNMLNYVLTLLKKTFFSKFLYIPFIPSAEIPKAVV